MSIGGSKMYDDLIELGYRCRLVTGVDGQHYVIIEDFEIQLGRFSGKKIELGLLAPSDYPRRVGAAIQVKSDPHLYDTKDTLANVRNILNSPLGEEWRYWSYAFRAVPNETAKNLMEEINGVFKRAL